MLSSRQRVANSLNLKASDRPPKGEIFISPEIIPGFQIDSLPEFLHYLNSDIATLILDKLDQKEWAQWRYSRFFIFGLVDGPLSRMFKVFGWKNAFMLINSKPFYTREIMEKFLIEHHALIRPALEQGCEGIIIADDLAGQHRLLFNPDYLENCYFPLISRLVENYPQVPFIFHSDGNILDIIQVIKDSGFKGLHSLQPSAGINAGNFESSLKSDWVFWGNFEYESADQMKSVFQIRKEIGTLLSSWNQSPGYIFGSSGGLYPGIPQEAIKAAYDMVDKTGTLT